MSHLKNPLGTILQTCAKKQSTMIRNFKVMSYNIWFDDSDRLGRLESLIATILTSNPDVICMQEVIPDVYEILKLKLSQYPHYFPETLEYSYGSVTMSKYPMEKCVSKEFKGSRMGRSLLISSINVPSIDGTITPIIVGNTHFESEFQRKESNDEKIYQYAYTQSILDSMHEHNDRIIFCSDSNLLSHEESMFFADDMWKDSWKEKGSTRDQFTYDYFTNDNLRKKNVGKFRSRLDRILYRNDNLKTEIFSVNKGIYGMLPPSDHHGVEATFVY